MHETVVVVRSALGKAASAMAHFANRHRRAVDICVGDHVWVRADHLRFSPQVSCKLTPRYFGPCTVIRAVNPVAF